MPSEAKLRRENAEVRSRMILDIPPEVQMAIKLRAVKNGWTTGEVVAEAMWHRFTSDMEDAAQIARENADVKDGA